MVWQLAQWLVEWFAANPAVGTAIAGANDTPVGKMTRVIDADAVGNAVANVTAAVVAVVVG